jgi:flagellar hook-basal body complex protein FliE
MVRINSLDASSTQKIQPMSAKSDSISFSDIFNEALEIEEQNQTKGLGHNAYNKSPLQLDQERELLAQALNPNEIEEVYDNLRRRKRIQEDQDEEQKIQALGTERLEITPFQLFIDKAVEVLESISQQDFRVNHLTEQYVKGEVSIDEVSVEMTKLNLAISFATTLLTSATNAFKEISSISI